MKKKALAPKRKKIGKTFEEDALNAKIKKERMKKHLKNDYGEEDDLEEA